MRLSDGEIRLHPVQKRVRAMFGGQQVVDSLGARLVYEPRGVPVYAFPVGDLRHDLLVDGDHHEADEAKGRSRHWSVRVGDRGAANAVRTYPDHEGSPTLRGLAMIDWDAMDAWFEEDEQVFSHARDPFCRVDVLQSGRHVVVEVGGATVADSRRPLALFETSLPPRWYLPKLDVRMDLLQAAPTRTTCPYKGTASHFTIHAGGRAHDGLAWEYEAPLPEVARIAHHICFLDEKVDVTIDGERQERPTSPFS